jgi:hypothetical protein
MTKMPDEPCRGTGIAGNPPSDAVRSAAGGSLGFSKPCTIAQLIETRLYRYCLSGGPVLGPALTTVIRLTVQKALAACFCLDIQGGALVLSGHARRRDQLTALVIYAPGMPWIVVQNAGYVPGETRSPLLRYLASGAEEVINPKPAAMAKSRVWSYLRRNGWVPASELLALSEIMRSDPPGVTWQNYLDAQITAIPQGPPFPIRLRRGQLLDIAAQFADMGDIQARLGLQKVAECCDPSLREQVAEDLNVKVCEYNYALDAPDPSIRARRLRWARTFPACWGLHRVSPIRELIDAAQPTIKQIASLLGCSGGIVRRLRTVEDTAIRLWTPNAYDYHVDRDAVPAYGEYRETGYDLGGLLLDGFAELTASQIPSAETLQPLADELPAGPRCENPARAVICASFHTAVRLTPSLQVPFGTVVPAFRPMMAATGGTWDVVAHQIEKITAGQVRGIADFVREMGRNLVLPTLLREDDGSESLLRLFEKARTQTALLLASRWHVGQFLKRSTEWHKAQGIVIIDQERGSCRELTWLPWFKPVRTGDLRIVPLCSSAALREEGIMMRHCVGGFDVECATQPTQIFSVQTLAGARLSTLQLQVRRGKKQEEFIFVMVQHHAVLNAKPPEEALAAAATLVAALNKRQIPHQVAKALNYRSKIEASDLCPFDFHDDAAWATARACYLPLLPADLRSLSPLEFGRLAANFKRPEPSCPTVGKEEPDSDSDDFETRVLRWMR